MIFYESWWDAVKPLPEAEARDALIAILAYGCEGVVPENLTGSARAMFLMAKPLIDANNARRENGAKGGRPRKDGNPTQRSNKFINFTPSETDWDEAARKVIAAQK